MIIILCFVNSALPASVLFQQPLNFGGIIVSPSSHNDVIEIDATNGAAKPVVLPNGFPMNFYSILDGNGSSGVIRLRIDLPGQTISIVYPESVTLQASGYPDTVLLDNINTFSKTFDTNINAGEEIDIDIGGQLHLIRGQAALSYSGTMLVTIYTNNQ